MTEIGVGYKHWGKEPERAPAQREEGEHLEHLAAEQSLAHMSSSLLLYDSAPLFPGGQTKVVLSDAHPLPRVPPPPWLARLVQRPFWLESFPVEREKTALVGPYAFFLSPHNLTLKLGCQQLFTMFTPRIP